MKVICHETRPRFGERNSLARMASINFYYHMGSCCLSAILHGVDKVTHKFEDQFGEDKKIELINGFTESWNINDNTKVIIRHNETGEVKFWVSSLDMMCDSMWDSYSRCSQPKTLPQISGNERVRVQLK